MSTWLCRITTLQREDVTLQSFESFLVGSPLALVLLAWNKMLLECVLDKLHGGDDHLIHFVQLGHTAAYLGDDRVLLVHA